MKKPAREPLVRNETLSSSQQQAQWLWAVYRNLGLRIPGDREDVDGVDTVRNPRPSGRARRPTA